MMTKCLNDTILIRNHSIRLLVNESNVACTSPVMEHFLRKADSNFSFSELVSAVGDKIDGWLHPTKRIRFLNQKTHFEV